MNMRSLTASFPLVEKLKDAGGLRAWLFSIAHSVLIDSIRREGRKKRSGPREDAKALDGVTDGRASPDVQLEREESRQRVLSLLRSLPEEYRLPLTLRYIGGADYETIGRELGLSNGSLRGLLHRGMEKLRAGMKHD